MIELEDLRDRTFEWSMEPRRRKECGIFEGDRLAGRIVLERRWRAIYASEFAGVEWSHRTRTRWLDYIDEFDFADGKKGLATMTHGASGVRATVDGAKYVFEGVSDGRAVWRDDANIVVLALHSASDAARQGSVRVYAACPIPHAPILLLLGITKVAFGGYFGFSGPKFLG